MLKNFSIKLIAFSFLFVPQILLAQTSHSNSDQSNQSGNSGTNNSSVKGDTSIHTSNTTRNGGSTTSSNTNSGTSQTQSVPSHPTNTNGNTSTVSTNSPKGITCIEKIFSDDDMNGSQTQNVKCNESRKIQGGIYTTHYDIYSTNSSQVLYSIELSNNVSAKTISITVKKIGDPNFNSSPILIYYTDKNKIYSKKYDERPSDEGNQFEIKFDGADLNYAVPVTIYGGYSDGTAVYFMMAVK